MGQYSEYLRHTNRIWKKKIAQETETDPCLFNPDWEADQPSAQYLHCTCCTISYLQSKQQRKTIPSLPTVAGAERRWSGLVLPLPLEKRVI